MTSVYLKIYAEFLKKFLKPVKKMRVVFDCSNGSTGIVMSSFIQTYKLTNFKLINWKADGHFPAHGPDPMKPGAMNDLTKAVIKNKADLGVIFDADGDRVFFVDDLGRPVHSDAVAALLSRNFKGSVILDVRAGYLARELITAENKKIIDSRVGHYFIKKLMRAKKIPFAAEISGHYYYKDFFYADSGIFTAIQFINGVSSIKYKVSSISDWLDSLPEYYRSGELNYKVQDKVGIMKKVEAHFKKLGAKISHLDGLRIEFSGQRPELAEGWFSLRPSNTEDLLRLNLEAKSKKVYNKKLRDLKKFIFAK